MVEKHITAGRTKLLEEFVDIINITDMIVILKQFNVFIIPFNAASYKLTDNFTIFNVKIIDENVLFDLFFNYWSSIKGNTCEVFRVATTCSSKIVKNFLLPVVHHLLIQINE